MGTTIEMAVGNAYVNLQRRGFKMSGQSQRWLKLLKHVLYKEEEILVSARQSRLTNIAPAKVFATKKRLIIVRPSFWGLYMGHDITSPTHYIIVPYKYIIGVSIAKGLIFSSIKLHTSSGIDPETSIKAEDEVVGIETFYSTRMATFIEEVIEQEGLEQETRKMESVVENEPLVYKNGLGMGISLRDAKKKIGDRKAQFIWLGVESAEDVAEMLGVRTESVVRMSGNELLLQTKAQLDAWPHLILVSYDDILSLHTYNLIRDKYDNIDMNILRGGITEVARGLRNSARVFS